MIPAIALGAAVMLTPAVRAQAPLTPADIEALRAQGEREGWTFTVGENEATQRPDSELFGLVEPPGWKPKEPVFTGLDGRSVPSAFDWRSPPSGYPIGVTPVRNQLSCGSCWAFSAVGAFECAIRIHDGIDTDLSEQWLVSCTTAGTCDGGWHTQALTYFLCEGMVDPCDDSGAPLEAEFPYQAANAPCICPLVHPYCLSSWTSVAQSNSAIKQAIYDHGPVSVTVYVNNAFKAYTSGVFNGCASGSVNHAVVLVGWSDSPSPGYWIMRNSWGPNWGEGGYMRIRYNCSSIGSNACFVTYNPPDCNSNGQPDTLDVLYGVSPDCNGNFVPDECELSAGTAADCNANGVPDDCDVASGFSADCNANGVPDTCDLASGASEDCNANGVPDTCDLASVFSRDCDSNGVPDECDISAGLQQDCNANGVPDECDFVGHLEDRSPALAPLGAGYPQSHLLTPARTALGNVTLAFEAMGDLNYASECVEVYLNATHVGTVFQGTVFDCVLATDQLVVPAAIFNAAGGGGPVEVHMVPSDSVSAEECAGSYIVVNTGYDCPPISLDLNGNGVPDECEAPPLCRGDCNCDHSVGFADIDFFVVSIPNNEAAWRAKFSPGAPSCSFASCDINGNGSVGFDDIDGFVALIPSSCP